MTSPPPVQARMPRGSRPVTAFVAALLATCVCAFAAVQAISLGLHHRTLGFSVHAITRLGRTTHWDAPAVLTAGIAAAVIGIGLLAAGLLPPRRRVTELAAADPRLAAGIPPAGLRRALRAAVTGIDGITAARLRGRRHLTITATTGLHDTTGLAEAIQATAAQRLALLARPPAVRVRLRREDH